jgi:hypothetical protein
MASILDPFILPVKLPILHGLLSPSSADWSSRSNLVIAGGTDHEQTAYSNQYLASHTTREICHELRDAPQRC